MTAWRKVVYCLAVAAGVSFAASAETYRVTPDAAGGGNGKAWADDGAGNAPVTLTEAIAKAANGDVILCKAGEYEKVAGSGNNGEKSSFLVAKPLTIRGGLKGTDDVTLDDVSPISTFTAPAQQISIFYVKTAAGTNVFENLKLTGVTANSRYYVFSAIGKTGAGSIEVRNCQIVNNSSAGDSYGYAQGLNLSGTVNSTAVISNCLFAGNFCTGYAKGNGQALRLSTFKEVFIDDCQFVTNGTSITKGAGNITGTNGGVAGVAIFASNAPIRAKNCSFVANRCLWINGVATGIVMLEGAGGETSFENCRWIGNSEMCGYILNANYGYDATTATRGGAIVVNFSSNESTVMLKNCTVAMNHTDSPSNAAGVTVVKGKLNVVDSIIANNIRPNYAAAGADLMVSGAAEATLSNVQLTANDASSFILGANAENPPSRSGLRFGDPLFVTPLSDVTACISTAVSWTYSHPYFNNASLPTLLAIDSGLTAESPALGLGASVATDPAIPTGTPSFGSVDVAFPAPYADPLVTVTMAGEDAYLATVAVAVKVGGETKATKSFFGVRSGDTLTFAPPVGLDAGDAVTVEATASVPGVDPVTDTASGTVPAEAVKAPWVGVVGEANVIYVREGADGAGTGLNWADAFPNVETAFASLSAERTEIWVAGSLEANAGVRYTAPVASFAVRGGFAGGEGDPSERPQDGSRTVIDFAAVKSGITIANGTGITATFDRLELRNTSEGAVVKSGAGDIEVTDCRFLNCSEDTTSGAGHAKGGAALRLSGSTDAQATVSGCVFEGCMGERVKLDVRGSVLHVTTFGGLELSNCLFLTNGLPWNPYKDGLNNIGTVLSIVHVSGAPVQATRCRFIGNRAATRDGTACFYLTGTSGGSMFDHCLWSANANSWTGVNNPGDHPSTATFVINLANATDKVDIIGCTMAYNLVDAYKGSGGLSVVKGAARIRDSIFYGNGRTTGGTGGNDLALQANGSADIAYSIFTAKPGSYDSITTVTEGNLTIDDKTTFFADDDYDPLFVTPLATAQGYIKTPRNPRRCFAEADKSVVCNFDLHIKSPGGYWLNDGTVVKDAETPTSPALDSGDPTSDFSNEPEPNGGCVNMGFYGNSTNASMTAAVELKVTDVRTTYPTNWSRPHIEADLGGSPGYTASVTIYCYTNDVLVTSRTFPNHVYGDTVAWDPAIYLVAGDTLVVRAVASAKGSDDAEGPASETEVEGEIPPWNGKGGGDGVIHVREGADGDATGLNWTDAYPTLEGITNLFANGNLPATYREIWIAGKIQRAPHAMTNGDKSNTLIPLGPLNVRGGFDGHENAPEERTDEAACATLDGGYACPGLLLSNGASSPVTVERIVFTRGVHMGLWKTGAGDITVRDCRFFNNKRTLPDSNTYHCGRGVGADLKGASGTTLAVVSNCIFEGNVFDVGGCDHGGGLYLEGLRQANLSNCLFLTNGIPFGVTVSSATYGNGSRGAAIHANGAPIMAANCRFVGNRANETGNSSEGGGTVVLSGACGGSSFVNCLWTGNEDAWAGYYNNNAATANDAGALMVMLGDKEQAVELRNCTVAYNYADRGYAGAGVTVHKGTVNVVDSILSGNFGGTVTRDTVGRDLTLCSSNAVASVRYSLLGTPDGLSASAVDPETLSTNAADGVIFDDPRFVTPYAFVTNLIVSQGADRYSETPHHRFSDAARDLLMGFNVHLRGGTGYLDETTGEVVKDWTRKRYGNSPAIDAGDPASACSNEPTPNGHCVNMGFYGNTPWATMSKVGTLIFVR